MIIAIKDKWAQEMDDISDVLHYIEIDQIDEQKAVEFIENYESTAPEAEYTLDDMLYYLEKKLGYNTDLTVNIVDAYF